MASVLLLQDSSVSDRLPRSHVRRVVPDRYECLGGRASDGRRSVLSRPDLHHVTEIVNEDLAVSRIPGSRGACNGIDHGRRERGTNGATQERRGGRKIRSSSALGGRDGSAAGLAACVGAVCPMLTPGPGDAPQWPAQAGRRQDGGQVSPSVDCDAGELAASPDSMTTSVTFVSASKATIGSDASATSAASASPACALIARPHSLRAERSPRAGP